MTFLNLLLLPFLAALGLFETAPPGDGGAGGSAGNSQPPATGDGQPPPASGDGDAKEGEDQLGDAGKRAIKAERDRATAEKRRADAAEAELQKVRAANQSEQEKAISDARKEGYDEATTKYEGLIRRATVESALTAAGSQDAAIASLAPDFATLAVNPDTGEVAGLDEAVKTFKAAHQTLFTARVASGSADQGAKPPAQNRPSSLEDAVNQHYASTGGRPS